MLGTEGTLLPSVPCLALQHGLGHSRPHVAARGSSWGSPFCSSGYRRETAADRAREEDGVLGRVGRGTGTHELWVAGGQEGLHPSTWVDSRPQLRSGSRDCRVEGRARGRP